MVQESLARGPLSLRLPYEALTPFLWRPESNQGDTHAAAICRGMIDGVRRLRAFIRGGDQACKM